MYGSTKSIHIAPTRRATVYSTLRNESNSVMSRNFKGLESDDKDGEMVKLIARYEQNTNIVFAVHGSRGNAKNFCVAKPITIPETTYAKGWINGEITYFKPNFFTILFCRTM
jgi:hypothetical protein